MWCTRWYLPLLLLPLPIAPPFFLALFLLSLTLHARPCFYCIVLLSALFLSTCYWPPVSIETPLMKPWSENITTYADALLSLMPDLSEDALPSDVPIVDHCWCDLTSGKFFEPFDMGRWETESVLRLKDELEAQEKLLLKAKTEIEVSEPDAEAETETEERDGVPSTTDEVLPEKTALSWSSILGTVWPFLIASESVPSAVVDALPSLPFLPDATEDAPPQPSEVPPSSASQPVVVTPLLRVRREYDLRPYGFEMVVDFGWSRRRS